MCVQCAYVCMTGGPGHHVSGDGASGVTAVGPRDRGREGEREDVTGWDGDGNTVAIWPQDTKREKG